MNVELGFKACQSQSAEQLLREIGPILTGTSKPVHVLQRGAEVNDIVNVAAIAVVDAQAVAKRAATK